VEKQLLFTTGQDLLGILYKDMTERDLLQRRTTKPNGDTIWIPSPLVSGALKV